MRVKFFYADGTFRIGEMSECPRLGDYVDAGLSGYHVSEVHWEPFQTEEDDPPADLAYDVSVRLEPGVAPQDRAKHLARTT